MRLQPEMQPGPFSAAAAKTAGIGKPAPSTKRPHPAAGGSRRKAAPPQGVGTVLPHRGVSDGARPAPPQGLRPGRACPTKGAEPRTQNFEKVPSRGRRRAGPALAIGCAAANQRAGCRRRPCAGRAGNRSSGKGAPVMAAALLGVASPCFPSVRRLLSFAETERPEGCSVFFPPVTVSASPEAGALHCNVKIPSILCTKGSTKPKSL